MIAHIEKYSSFVQEIKKEISHKNVRDMGKNKKKWNVIILSMIQIWKQKPKVWK